MDWTPRQASIAAALPLIGMAALGPFAAILRIAYAAVLTVWLFVRGGRPAVARPLAAAAV